MSDANKLRERGERLREDTKFLEALHILDEAIIEFQKNGDYNGLIMTLKDRSLTWLHLYNYTQDEIYAILSKKDAESMVDIASHKKIKSSLAISYFTLAKSNVLLKDYSSAIDNYQKALDHHKGTMSERGDYRYHLGEALCLTGNNKHGIPLLKEGLSEIRQGRDEVDKFLANIWESRCLMILAQFLEDNNPEEARKYAMESKKIIDSDDRLVILNKQLNELLTSLQPLILLTFSTPAFQNLLHLNLLN